MSIFDSPNEEAYHGTIDEASTGPRLGFQDALVAAWDAQHKVNAQNAVTVTLADAVEGQKTRMRDAGLRPAPSDLSENDSAPDTPFVGQDPLSDDSSARTSAHMQDRYSQAARILGGVDTGSSDVDGQGGGVIADTIKAHDDHITRERVLHPELGLQTYAEMFGDIQKSAQEAAKRDSYDKTIAGHIGAFVGGAAASMDIRRDPLNVIAAPLAGGETIAARMGVQAGVQGGAAGLNLLLNPDQNRELFGRDLTTAEKGGRVMSAALGGALLQGAGEVVGIGARRLTTGKWFADAPLPPTPKPEPAPPIETGPGVLSSKMPAGLPLDRYPNWESFAAAHGGDHAPYGTTREAQPRTAADVNYIATQLDRWDGGIGDNIPARLTDTTAIPRNVEPGVRYDGGVQRFADSLETVDDVARRLDPDLFRTYDALAARVNEIRGHLAALDKTIPDHVAADPIFRRALQSVDFQMRDMAPLVSRVYGAAEREWRSTPIDNATLDYLKSLEDRTGWRYRGEDKPSLTEKPLRTQERIETPQIGVNDKVPLAKLSPSQEVRIGDANAAERVHAAVDDNLKMMDEKVDHFVKQARNVADAEKHGEAVTKAKEKVTAATDPEAKAAAEKELDDLDHITMPDGSRLRLDDKIHTDAGEISVRDFLREMDKDQHALQSVVTCSRPS